MVTHIQAAVSRTDSAEDSEIADLLDRLQRARKSRSADRIHSAEQALALRFQSFAAAQARRFAGRGVDLDDLMQIANVGLMKAIHGWRPQPDNGLLQYAKSMVTGELRRYFRDQVPMIRLPRRLQEAGTAVAMARRDLAVLDRDPTDSEIAAAAGLPEQDVRENAMARSITDVSSLDADRFGSEPMAIDSKRDFGVAEVRVMLGTAIASLTDRERTLVELRYFRDLTQEQIGKVIGVSQMQVSRLLRRALTKMQGQLAA